jgi:hypothetical protein
MKRTTYLPQSRHDDIKALEKQNRKAEQRKRLQEPPTKTGDTMPLPANQDDHNRL